MSTLAENLIRLQEAKNNIADAITEKGGTASYSDGLELMGDKIRAIPTPQPTLITKSITQNGTYSAADDSADGYSEASVNVQSKEIPKQKSTRPALSGREVYSSTWSSKSWDGYNLSGDQMWTDGDNIYYSRYTDQYVLDRSTGKWTRKTWSGLTSFLGDGIWTDGDNICYSRVSTQYVLDKTTSTWFVKTWSGLASFSGDHIWTDGYNVYYSFNSNQYVLDKSTSTWSTKTWSGLPSTFYGYCVWTDGDNIYYSYQSTQYILNKSTSTWSLKSWSGLSSFQGNYIWTDGDNIYYSNGSTQYVLDKSTSTWTSKSWSGLGSLSGNSIWTDGDNIYCYTSENGSLILDKQSKPTILTTTCKPKFNS